MPKEKPTLDELLEKVTEENKHTEIDFGNPVMTETERLQNIIDQQKKQLSDLQSSGILWLKAKQKLDAIREICDMEKRPGHVKVFKIKEILEGDTNGGNP